MSQAMSHHFIFLTVNSLNTIYYYCLLTYPFIYTLDFQDKIALCSPGYRRTHSADQARIKLGYPPTFASQVLGLVA